MEPKDEGRQEELYELERQSHLAKPPLRRKARILVWVGVLGIVVYFLAYSANPELGHSFGPSVGGDVANTTVTDGTIPNEPTSNKTTSVASNPIVVPATQSHSANRPKLLVNHDGMATFRENLLPSTKYITAFHFAGFTNQVMEAANLLYLALLTNRVPIIPAFYPTHLGSPDQVASPKFGDIFDVPYLSNKLGIPIIEWHELKRPKDSSPGAPAPVTEKLGCWSVTAGNDAWGQPPGRPTEAYSQQMYNLDVSYTPIPSSFTLTHGADPKTIIWSTWSIASLGYPQTRAQVVREQTPRTFPLHDGSGEKLEPDDHLLCFDFLYFIGLNQLGPAEDFFADYSPYWNEVGIHMRWKKSLVRLANQYLRRHFAIEYDSDPIPPFISVHIRRADFQGSCTPGFTKDECFAPIAAYHRRVQEVKERLKNRPNGVDVQAVLVTSDEQDPAWWDQVAALGPEWRWIDHKAERSVEKYGDWFALLLDVVFQSMGKGFVGTTGSTMSQFALKRVEAWNDGEVAVVRWGRPGADDH